MSIQNNFPAIRPSLNLDFANTKELDPRITFTRASTASYYGTQTAKAEENLLLRSQDFTTSWTAGGGVVVTPNTEVAPDGTTTADTVTATAATAVHIIGQTVVGSSLPRVMSVFAKKGTNNYVQLCLAGDGAPFANFDLDLGIVGTKGASVTSSIASVGNGWYRCTMEYTSAAGTSFDVSLANSASMARRATWTALGTETVYLWGAQLEQRSSVTAYTPTTTQPITNYIPVLETAASGVARFDHNPTTFESLGFLVEEQRTNLVTYSEQFDNAAWSKSDSTISANTVVAPDGTLTGDKLIENTANAQHQIFVSPTVVTNATYTASFYMKAAERTVVRVLAFNGSGDSESVAFNLLTGATTIVGDSAATMTAVGNNWWRCSMTFNNSVDTGTTLSIALANASVSYSYTGDGYSGIYVWGAQLEAGAFPTSYIPTVASQVTRAADSASMTGVNFSIWYRADEGTLYGESSSLRDTATRWPFGVDDGSASNLIGVRFTSTQVQNRVLVSGVTQADIAVSQTTGYAKTALGYAFNNVAASVDGGTVSTDTSANIPVVSQLSIGRVSGGTTIKGYIRKIAYYPKRLSDAELQGLTS